MRERKIKTHTHTHPSTKAGNQRITETVRVRDKKSWGTTEYLDKNVPVPKTASVLKAYQYHKVLNNLCFYSI